MTDCVEKMLMDQAPHLFHWAERLYNWEFWYIGRDMTQTSAETRVTGLSLWHMLGKSYHFKNSAEEIMTNI